MAGKKPKSETGKKNRKLSLKKRTVRDLTARRDAAEGVRGGRGVVTGKTCLICLPGDTIACN